MVEWFVRAPYSNANNALNGDQLKGSNRPFSTMC